jgi:hypothetical protein
MKASYAWILLGIAIAVILYLVFRPLPVIDNKQAIKTLDSLKKENDLFRSSLSAQFNNFRLFKDSSIHVIDSLEGRNIDLKSVLNITEAEKQDLALQILNHKPEQSIDSPCLELARKVLADSLLVIDYQKNTDRLIFSFNQGIDKRDSLIERQQWLIISDSVLINTQHDLYTLQEKQLKKVQRQGKTSAWLARSLAVVSLVLGGILLSK